MVDWYKKIFDFFEYWQADMSVVNAEYTALNSKVVSDIDETILIPITEPVNRKGRSQTQEFVDFSGGPGIQHVAITCDDIITTVK